MIGWILSLLFAAFGAAALGFSGVAQLFFALCLVLLVVTLVTGAIRRHRLPPLA